MRRRRFRRSPKAEYENALKKMKEIFLSDELPNGEVIDIEKYYTLSKKTLGEYVTLDWNHKSEIEDLIKTIKKYSNDFSQNRPLNIVMIAEPGLGKSHFISCLAQKMKNTGVSGVSFNMAIMQTLNDLIQPIEAVRNLKVVDKLPLLFLDEIDSNPQNYARLLPLMWDGEISLGNRDLKLGKVVLIMAASNPDIKKVMKSVQSMQSEIESIKSDQKKLVDLLSRVNGGVVEIPQLDKKTKMRDRRIDKVCLSISLLQRKFGPDLEMVPWALLRFIALSRFRYGVRSISHFIDTIPGNLEIEEVLNLKDFHLPLDSKNEIMKSSLAYHLIAEEEPESIVETWKEISAVETLVRFESEWEEI